MTQWRVCGCFAQQCCRLQNATGIWTSALTVCDNTEFQESLSVAEAQVWLRAREQKRRTL